jgi:hypothetical protein
MLKSWAAYCALSKPSPSRTGKEQHRDYETSQKSPVTSGASNLIEARGKGFY